MFAVIGVPVVVQVLHHSWEGGEGEGERGRGGGGGGTERGGRVEGEEEGEKIG